MLFRLESVGKEYSADWLFRGVTAQCNPGDRIGLIGRNGTGKTTLFNLIEGRLPPDQGKVHRAASLQISRVEQIPNFNPETTVWDEALKVFRHFKLMEARLHELDSQMARLGQNITSTVANEYEELRLKLRLHGGYDYMARTEAVLMGLGFSQETLDGLCVEVSGGQQNRLLLAKALLHPADLLLLDEPTNHLDLQGILWLTEYLQNQKASFVVISHDREFLDAVTRHTWEIEGQCLGKYPGNFTRARQLREERLRLQEKAYEQQQEWKGKTENFIRRNIAGQKTRQAQSRRKRLQKTEWIQKPFEEKEKLKVQIQDAGRGGALSFWIQQGTIGYPGKALIENVNLRLGRGDRVGILGDNGTGKTTLLKTLISELPLLEGALEWGTNNSPAYFSQDPSLGDGDRTVYDALRELDLSCTDLELRNFAARFLFKDDDVYKSIDKLSGGERSRLALARLLLHPANVLIMDEPTNHLDIGSREALEEALNEYGGTLVVVSHDRYFLKNVVHEFYLIRDRRLRPVESICDLSALVVEETHQDTKPRLRPKSSTPSKNERRRRERTLLELEARIEALEKRTEQILFHLQSGYDDFSRLHELSEEHEQIQSELDRLYQAWEKQAGEFA